MKKILCLLLLIFVLVSCDKTETPDPMTPDNPITPVVPSEKEDEWDLNEMMNDPNAMGQYGNKDNVNRYPEDELYDLIVNKSKALQVNETYVEDFEKEDLYKRFYPISVSDGASFTYENSPNYSIDGTSLCLRSQGDYAGLTFGGMKFAKNSTYRIKFDYKIITASNDFFFQFRSITGGTPTDIYQTISGNSGDTGTIDRIFYLGDYVDYQVMFFPRNYKGTIVIDNVEFTRLNSKPRIISCDFVGDLNVGQTIQYDYQYYDSEDDLEENTEAKWYVSLDKNGKNKELIAEGVDTVKITEDMVGKYLGVSLKPTSNSNDEFAEGNLFTYYTKNKIGGVDASIGSTIQLDYGEEFNEDFESDTNVEGNIYFNDDVNTYSYITTQNPIDGERSLYISSAGSFAYVKFDGIKFQAKGIYELTFDYKFISKGENFYVQMRTDSSDYSHDKFVNVDMSKTELSKIYHFKTQFSLDGFSDYYLMMFPSNMGYELIIDNLKYTRLEGVNNPVVSKELQVGETLEEDFNDLYSLKIGFDLSQTPNCEITSNSDLVIDGKSLYFESDGSYHCLFINNGLIYTPNATYKVEFDYRIIDFNDTVYFQLNSGSNTVYKQFGSPEEAGQLCHFEASLTIDAATNYVMQIFPGATQGLTKIIIDNLKITRIE